jgi:hypothetical protein
MLMLVLIDGPDARAEVERPRGLRGITVTLNEPVRSA